jgi:hypothetical protein
MVGVCIGEMRGVNNAATIPAGYFGEKAWLAVLELAMRFFGQKTQKENVKPARNKSRSSSWMTTKRQGAVP